MNALYIKTGLFFGGSRLTLQNLLQILYWWTLQEPVVNVAKETNVSRQIIIEWYNYICAVCMLENPV